MTYPRYFKQESATGGFDLIDRDTGRIKFAHPTEETIDRFVNYWNGQMEKTDQQILDEHRYTGFSIGKRNLHHWDIYADRPDFPDPPHSTTMGHCQGARERAFRIRGEPGKVILMDERTDPTRPHPRESLEFMDITQAMVFITQIFMKERT